MGYNSSIPTLQKDEPRTVCKKDGKVKRDYISWFGKEIFNGNWTYTVSVSFSRGGMTSRESHVNSPGKSGSCFRLLERGKKFIKPRS